MKTILTYFILLLLSNAAFASTDNFCSSYGCQSLPFQSSQNPSFGTGEYGWFPIKSGQGFTCKATESGGNAKNAIVWLCIYSSQPLTHATGNINPHQEFATCTKFYTMKPFETQQFTYSADTQSGTYYAQISVAVNGPTRYDQFNPVQINCQNN